MKTLIVVSSKTGNTLLLARGICDALKDCDLVEASSVPENLSEYGAVLLGFWCDRGMSPEDMQKAARGVHGKRIGCFATIGGDPDSDWARKWMDKTSQELAALGEGNTLEATFMCRGRIDPAVFKMMTKMAGGTVTPEREARRQASETHPDRLDVLHAAEVFGRMLG